MTETSSHPTALSPVPATFRFLVELAALMAWAIVGWRLLDGAASWLGSIALPAAAATLWGLFRVPGDQSAGSDGAIPVPGPLRLAVEVVVLLGAAFALAVAWSPLAGALLAVAVLAQGASTARRLRWLVSGEANAPI
ncbi:MAG: YrdB family protein [Ilumatobacter sp.]|nr:YrdB family protein [Ilumatobacter sp.]